MNYSNSPKKSNQKFVINQNDSINDRNSEHKNDFEVNYLEDEISNDFNTLPKLNQYERQFMNSNARLIENTKRNKVNRLQKIDESGNLKDEDNNSEISSNLSEIKSVNKFDIINQDDFKNSNSILESNQIMETEKNENFKYKNQNKRKITTQPNGVNFKTNHGVNFNLDNNESIPIPEKSNSFQLKKYGTFESSNIQSKTMKSVKRKSDTMLI